MVQQIGTNREMEKCKEQKIENNPTILVLLSTYNGEKYLREQLDSILSQKGCEVKLLVRDDGSNDTTKEILREYQHGNNKEKFLAVVPGKNIGAVGSFFELLHEAGKYPYEYYALADQDDIWQEEKLFAAVGAIVREKRGGGIQQKSSRRKNQNGKSENRAYLYASTVQPVDEQGENIPAGLRYPKRKPAFGNALVENICTGCTCVMDRGLVELFCGAGRFCSTGRKMVRKSVVMHDFWLYLLASAFGKVIFDETPHIRYRQHGNNSVGMASTVWENYKRRIRDFKKNRGKLRRQARMFGQLYGEELKRQDREKAELLRDFVAGKLGLVLDGTLYRQRKSDDVIMKVLLLFGWL